jgi:hypothetical protein
MTFQQLEVMNSQTSAAFDYPSMSDEAEAARWSAIHGFGDVNIPLGEELDDPIERAATGRLFGSSS